MKVPTEDPSFVPSSTTAPSVSVDTRFSNGEGEFVFPDDERFDDGRAKDDRPEDDRPDGYGGFIKVNSARRSGGFSYDPKAPNGPNSWGKINRVCNGNSQSPVNLQSSIVGFAGRSQPLIIDGLQKIPEAIRYNNNGHSVQIRFRFTDRRPVRVHGGPLKTAYILDNVHWHWGLKDNLGSEHLLDSKRYAAEAHFVMYNSRYGKIACLLSSYLETVAII